METVDSGSSMVSFSPSFNSYCSDKLAETVVRVSRELLLPGEVEEFEFVTVEASSFGNRDLTFPLFNREHNSIDQNHVDSVGVQLRNLFLQERDPPSSSSSSEADELEGVPPESYCAWGPARSTAKKSPIGCKKSNSTGSSSSMKRFRLRDLMKRSHSDGKDSFLFLNPNPIVRNGKGESKARGKKVKMSAHEELYVKNKALKEADKRRSYLPYRQGLVGLFANMNGLTRFGPY